jgi:hypothetical protein
MHFEKARELFTALVRTPLEWDVTPDLVRYFKTQALWETAEFRTLSKEDLLFLNQAKQRFNGEPFETWLRDWKSGRITETEIRSELTTGKNKRSVDFETVLLTKQPDFRASRRRGCLNGHEKPRSGGRSVSAWTSKEVSHEKAHRSSEDE